MSMHPGFNSADHELGHIFTLILTFVRCVRDSILSLPWNVDRIDRPATRRSGGISNERFEFQ